MADSGKAPRKTPREGRPQAAPPALLSAGEPFDGFDVLDEWRDAKSLPLWQALRDGILWAGTPAARRAELFSPAALRQRARELRSTGLDPDLLPPLQVLSHVLQADSGVTEEQVAAALRVIAEWAESHDRPRTAIAFAQGAALVLPRNPEYAYTVGLYCRRNAEYNRAETWFRRTRVLSRKAGDQQSFALSWMGLGNVYIQQGRYGDAKAAHLRALRISRRRGLWHIKAMALHDLFTIAVDLGEVLEAEQLAHQAARSYAVTSPQFQALASDIATFWMNQGFYERALVVFQVVTRLLTRTDARLVALSSLGRTAAGVGDLKLFTDAWIAVHRILDGQAATCRAGVSLLMLAYGAAALDDWERAKLAAGRALELSSERGESEVSVRARDLLGAIQERRYTPELMAAPSDPEVIEAADSLARLLVRRLDGRVRHNPTAYLREAFVRSLHAPGAP
jgi:tetratricopeptide (TPR) repeat protein